MGWQRRMKRIGGRIGVWMYRTLDGKLASGRKDVHVLVITVRGRRTGQPRSTCVRFLATEQGLVVWGTGSGSKTDPDWFRNLREVDVAEVQILSDRLTVRVRELRGDERNSVWHDVVLTQAPEVERYARRAGRTIPIAVLAPLPAD